MTAAEILIQIEDDGTLRLPPEALKALGTRFVFLSIEEDGNRAVRVRPRRLHEIEDVEERMRHFTKLMQQIGRPGPARLPENWDSRESIYD